MALRATSPSRRFGVFEVVRIAVLGAGAWGTALANTFSSHGHSVGLWTIDAAHAEMMARERTNSQFLPGVPFHEALVVGADFASVCAEAELAIVVTPVAGLRPTLQRLARLGGNIPVLWACKGFEAETGKLPHEVAEEYLVASVGCGALTGPSFALEVAQGLPCAITLASANRSFAQEWAKRLNLPRLRLYANDDIVGAEIGGAVKNVLAIAAGISDGLGYGLNARAALITRGLAEMARLSESLGGRRDTLMGLAGMGDLILTATGDLSRNRRVGLELADGQGLADILGSLGHVAEGVLTTQVVLRRATEMGVDMPITRAVNEVLGGRLSPRSAVELLMSRDPKNEI
ncbi:MAG: Glycerol-3-phosphate dehydrogenase [Pseudomonadota bacterium]|jgi:glycerol-3-phosphate dehydrogenase (NAD(P)+)